jgi:hypothetical protein
MIWPAMLFNLCIALLFAGFLFRAVRRFERRVDAIIAKLNEDDAESQRKFDAARDEIRASMRAATDRAIAEMTAMAARSTHAASAAETDTSSNHDPASPSGDRNGEASPSESSPSTRVGS